MRVATVRGGDPSNRNYTGRRWIYTAANRYVADKVNSRQTNGAAWRGGDEARSCLRACTSDQLRARIDWWKNGGENRIDRLACIRPRINPFVQRSTSGRSPVDPRPRRWSIRLPGQFPPIIRSPPSCCTPRCTPGEFIVRAPQLPGSLLLLRLFQTNDTLIWNFHQFPLE